MELQRQENRTLVKVEEKGLKNFRSLVLYRKQRFNQGGRERNEHKRAPELQVSIVIENQEQFD